MKTKAFIAVFLVFLTFLSLLSFYTFSKREETFEDRRERIMGELSLAIDDVAEEGKYKCCIDPPCTMCYLGNWIWKDGICRCDEMIATGQDDKVCPQCVKGIEEGRCKSFIKHCNMNTFVQNNISQNDTGGWLS